MNLIVVGVFLVDFAVAAIFLLHFKAILDQLAAVSVDRHASHVFVHLSQKEALVVVQAVLQNAAEDERAKLVLYELFVVIENVVYELVLGLAPAVFNQTLNYPAGVFVDAALADVGLDLRKELVEQLLVFILIHNGHQLLHNMIAVKVEHQFNKETFDAGICFTVIKFDDELEYLLDLKFVKDVETSLNHATCMLVATEFLQVAHEALENHVLLIRASLKEQFLQNIVAVHVRDDFIEDLNLAALIILVDKQQIAEELFKFSLLELLI